MQLTNQIHPTKEQFQKMVASYPKDTPVTMINILKFRRKTEAGNETGVEAYTRYGLNTLPFMKKHGCLLYTSPSPRDRQKSRMPSSA